MDLVYPWDSQKCRAPQSVKAQIWGDLFKQNSLCLKYREPENIPDKKVLTIIEDVYGKVEEKKWVVVTCDSIKILQSFAEVFPMAYSFTSRQYSMSVTTDKLIFILNDKEYVDNYLQQTLTKKEKLHMYPLLFWEGILTAHKWGKGYQGNIANIFHEKIKLEGILVATVHCSANDAADFPVSFLRDFGMIWGSQLKNIIQEMAVFMKYRVHTDTKIVTFDRDI